MEKKKIIKDNSSFRDPSGYIYYKDNNIYRKINKSYIDKFEHFINSGLYEELVKNNLIVKHEIKNKDSDSYDILVQKIPFITYPYEWCFDQLKDAALLTLKIQKIALKYGMTLKDASAYNIQFFHGKCIFIDTLSFDFYEDNMPWGAYGQFIRHFLAPLLLMSYVDENLNCLLKNYIDGIPIDLANNILKSRGGFTSYIHIKLHNKAILKNNTNEKAIEKAKVSKNGISNIIDMLYRQIENLKRKKVDSQWNNYYENTNYIKKASDSKANIVESYLKKIKINNNDIVWDLGANDGKYSKIASSLGAYTICFDIDNNSINRCYNIVKDNNEENLLPLILDLNNPSPAIGFGLVERKSLNERADIKCIMALAIIHHLAISNNVPLINIAKYFSSLSKYLIIEFIPKEDSKVETLLKTRLDIFDNYNIETFEKEFSTFYKIIKKDNIDSSKRVMYLMEKKDEEK